MQRREFIAASAAAIALTPIDRLSAAFASTRFSSVVWGSGPDVILIPGLTSSRQVWTGLVAALPGYRYHLLQVAGFAGDAAGGNAKGPVLEPLATEVARYISSNGLRSPAIIGHSMGGTLAMMIAARHGGLVGKIMVVDILPAPAGMLGVSAAGIRPFADSLLDALTGTTGGQQLLQSFLGGGGSGPPLSDPNLVARVTHELAVTDLTPELRRITVPMSVVYATARADGTFDPAITVQNYRNAYRGAPTARLVRIANSGHMIMLDQSVKFTAAVKDFLAR